MQAQQELNTTVVRGRRPSTKVIALILAGILIAASVLGYMIWKSKYQVQKTGSYICDQSLFDKAVGSLESRTPNELKSAVDEMVMLPNFEKSANCLYIAFHHSVTKVDIQAARLYHGKLTDLQKRTTQTYDSRLQPFVHSNDDLINLINLLEKGGPTPTSAAEVAE